MLVESGLQRDRCSNIRIQKGDILQPYSPNWPSPRKRSLPTPDKPPRQGKTPLQAGITAIDKPYNRRSDTSICRVDVEVPVDLSVLAIPLLQVIVRLLEVTAVEKSLRRTQWTRTISLRDAINSASSITQNLTSELADGQRKILALVTGNTKALNPMAMQQPNGPMGGLQEVALSLQQVEAPLDPTKELSRLISEHKFGEAFTMALQRSDVTIVSWLCSQVDLHAICSMVPVPLNQGVLLALLQQLACDISKEMSRKLGWMTDVALAINPTDAMITLHVRPIFEQVYNILAHQRSLPTTTASEATSIRLVMHVINSVLMSCK